MPRSWKTPEHQQRSGVGSRIRHRGWRFSLIHLLIRLSRLLDPGERAAITLALFLRADRLLMDDWDGRLQAKRRHLVVTGTLGVLGKAHQQQLLDFENALARLSATNFYVSSELIDHMRRRLTTTPHT